MTAPVLKLGLPSGSLQEATAQLFAKAGYKITFASRSYYPAIDDPEIHCTLIRAQEMARYVEDGSLDCGLTGHDWIVENDARVVEVAELVFSKVSRRPVRWVLAVPNNSPVETVKALEGKRVAPEVGNLTRPLAGQPRGDGPRRVQLGRHGGQAAAPRRRHRRGDGDRLVAEGQQPPHRLRHPPEHDALHRQREGLRRPLEEGKDRRHG